MRQSDREHAAKRLAGIGLARSIATTAAIALLALLGVLAPVRSPAAHAQNDEVYETCALYNVAISTGAQSAVRAAERLREVGAPNPPRVESALDVLIDAEDGGETPANEEFESAIETLDDYFGAVCNGIDVCPLIASAIDANDARSQRSADWARRILSPSPPGIGAALSLIAGEIQLGDQLIHESVADARIAVRDYFASCTLAHTGSTALPVALIGIGLAATGSAVLIVRRNLHFS